jgi:Outer membrane cobalamin receptor protein
MRFYERSGVLIHRNIRRFPLLNKYRFFLTIVSIALLLLTSSVIWADDSDKNVTEEEVVITATRTAKPETKAPGKTEVITKEEIEQSGATTAAEALTDAGITISSNGGKSGAATAQLDGSNSFQTLVLVNGVPTNVGPDGSTDLSYLPTSAIERIEVSHGPLSALYGSSAIGGVINIITNLTGQASSEAVLSGGSFNTKSTDIKYRQLNWGLAAGGGMTDGYRNYSKTYSNYLMGQYNFFQTNDEYLKLYFQDLSKHGQQPGSITWPSEANESDQNVAMNLNGLSKIWGGEWEYKIYGQHDDLQYNDSFSDYEHQISSYGIDAAGRYQLGVHELLAGITTKDEIFDSTTFGGHSRMDNGLFLQDNWQLGSRYQLIAGLRQDYYSKFSSPLLPKVTFIDSINDQITIKAGYGKTFRAPSFEDLYWNETGMYGNPDLKPENGERYDLIAEWKQQQQAIYIDIYQSHLQDYIAWAPTDASGMVWEVSNLHKTEMNGIGLNWQNTWANLVTAKIGYNYLENKVTDPFLGDNQVYNYFGKQQFNLGLDFKYQAWLLGMNWYYVTDRDYVSSGITYQLPDYDVLNLNLQYSINHNLSFTLIVDNSTDEQYQVKSGYPMPGRCYTLSSKYTF